jgi:hypothetical protein
VQVIANIPSELSDVVIWFALTPRGTINRSQLKKQRHDVRVTPLERRSR